MKTTVLIFKPQFREPILAGTKRQTIRFPRKRAIEPGYRLSLRQWSGRPYESPQRIIGDAVCSAVVPVRIDWDGQLVIELHGRRLPYHQLEAFARRDGFASAFDMAKYWGEGMPFEGVAYQWGDFRPAKQDGEGREGE